MLIIMTSLSRQLLVFALNKEQKKNPEAVFRIWETTTGRYDDAQISLRLSLDDKEEDDEFYICHDLRFVASQEFLSLRGEPHFFFIFTDETGKPAIIEICG